MVESRYAACRVRVATPLLETRSAQWMHYIWNLDITRNSRAGTISSMKV